MSRLPDRSNAVFRRIDDAPLPLPSQGRRGRLVAPCPPPLILQRQGRAVRPCPPPLTLPSQGGVRGQPNAMQPNTSLVEEIGGGVGREEPAECGPH